MEEVKLENLQAKADRLYIRIKAPLCCGQQMSVSKYAINVLKSAVSCFKTHFIVRRSEAPRDVFTGRS